MSKENENLFILTFPAGNRHPIRRVRYAASDTPHGGTERASNFSFDLGAPSLVQTSVEKRPSYLQVVIWASISIVICTRASPFPSRSHRSSSIPRAPCNYSRRCLKLNQQLSPFYSLGIGFLGRYIGQAGPLLLGPFKVLELFTPPPRSRAKTKNLGLYLNLMMQSLIDWLNEGLLLTIAQSWTAPVSVLGHSRPFFSLSLSVQSSLFTLLSAEFSISLSVFKTPIISEWPLVIDKFIGIKCKEVFEIEADFQACLWTE